MNKQESDYIQRGYLFYEISEASPAELHHVLENWELLQPATPYSTSFDFHTKPQQSAYGNRDSDSCLPLLRPGLPFALYLGKPVRLTRTITITLRLSSKPSATALRPKPVMWFPDTLLSWASA